MMLVLLKEESPQAIRIISRIGSRVPVNWAAAGRLLISDLDDEAYAKVMLTLASKGGVRTETLRAFPEDEFRDIVASVT